MLVCGFGIFWFGASADVLSNWALLIPGALTGVLGVILLVRAVRRFMAAKTTVNPHTPSKSSELVIEGEYRWTRNPMYLGMLLGLVGFAIYFGTAESFIFPVILFCVINWYHIPFEEEKMAEAFGDEFADYKAKVRRWI